MSARTHLSAYRAPWWLPGGHLQTLWRKLAPLTMMQRERSRVELTDGDFIDLDWLRAPALSCQFRQRPLVLLLHGLAGCSSSPYVLSMQNVLQHSGYDSVAMNLRGCSGEFNRLATAYHSGCSDDLEQVVRAILIQQGADTRLAVIGYSLGANVMVKWLSEFKLSGFKLSGFGSNQNRLNQNRLNQNGLSQTGSGETSSRQHVVAAVSVSNPFSLALCCDRMNSGVAFWYGRYFLNRLRTDLASKTLHLESNGRDDELARIRDLGSLDSLRTLWDFDEAVTAPLHGFAGAEDYYQRCSSRQFVSAVQAPMLIVHGHNDPIIPLNALPEAGELPASVLQEILPGGGHVGFAASGEPQWLEQRILQFVARQFAAGLRPS